MTRRSESAPAAVSVRYLASIVALTMVALATIGILTWRASSVQHDRNVDAAEAAMNELGLQIDTQVRVGINHVQAMAEVVQAGLTTTELLSGGGPADFARLAPSPVEGFPLSGLPSAVSAHTGLIVTRPGVDLARTDLRAAFRYATVAEAAHRGTDFLRWSYVYLADGTATMLYPPIAPEEVFANTGTRDAAAAIDVIFEAGGTLPLQLMGPSRNPGRDLVLTPPYVDAGGAGLMVSMLQPVYERDRFAGGTGTDITLANLETTIRERSSALERVVLIDGDGHVLADSNGQVDRGAVGSISGDFRRYRDATRTSPDMVASVDGGLALSRSVTGTGWTLLAFSRDSALNRLSGQNALLIPLSLLAVVVVLGGALLVNHHMGRPALRLVRFLNQATENSDAPIPRVPGPWVEEFAGAQRVLRQWHQQRRELTETNEALQGTLDTLALSQSKLIASERDALLSSVVSSISHDIATPLGNISLVAESLLEHEQDTLRRDPQDAGALNRAEGLRLISDNVGLAGDLVRRVTRSSVRMRRSEVEEVLVLDLIGEIRWLLSPRLGKGGVSVVIEVPDSLLVFAPRGALAQVMTNLITNALTHAFPSGRPGTIRIAARPDGDRVTIEVEDDGIGMDPTVAAHAFEAYFTTAERTGGSGLGLHIVRNVVTNQCNGSIELYSNPGSGTTFRVSLPAAPW